MPRRAFISPFLKKRLVSRAFDGVDDCWPVGVHGDGVGVGARANAAVWIPRNRQRMGGAVKAGAEGPARRGSLDGPGGSVVASHHQTGPPAGAVLVCGGLDTAGLIIALVLSWATE